MPINRGEAGRTLAEASFADQNLTVQKIEAISFGREPEYSTPLRDLLQQPPHIVAECRETLRIDGCRPRLIREIFLKVVETAAFTE